MNTPSPKFTDSPGAQIAVAINTGLGAAAGAALGFVVGVSAVTVAVVGGAAVGLASILAGDRGLRVRATIEALGLQAKARPWGRWDEVRQAYGDIGRGVQGGSVVLVVDHEHEIEAVALRVQELWQRRHAELVAQGMSAEDATAMLAPVVIKTASGRAGAKPWASPA